MSAVIRNSKGEPAPRVQVALWPDKSDAGNASSSIRVAITDDMGVARFQGLRPEKYRLAAFADAEQGFVRSPDFLDRFTWLMAPQWSAQSSRLAGRMRQR